LQEGTALRIEEVVAGSGRAVGAGDTVRVHYTAVLASGSTIRDTRTSGPPVEIMIGSTKAICGFEKALVGMHAGGERRVFVPWRLAFGESGRSPDIEPRADLVFVIDLYLPSDAVTEHGSPPINPARGRGR
jgi:FKBP-type peptidyl-prolyl cis-trans isomerase